ncbi:hypothetical protein M8818_005467 [Zalaria obscura]|uniref:Uncharacterized protein n=1 Tax=Zalaria obscura TaxID=2024903 RepID=A0ACC3S8Q4_9PEZI
MASSQPSPQTLQESPTAYSPPQEKLDLSALPPIFVSNTHLDTEDLHELEDNLVEAGATLTWDITEAKIVLSRVERKRRAQFDLQRAGLWTEEITVEEGDATKINDEASAESAAKRRRVNLEAKAGKDEEKAIVIDGSDTESEAETDSREKPKPIAKQSSSSIEDGGPVKPPSPQPKPIEALFTGKTVRVIRIDWFEECVKAKKLLPFEQWLVYHGKPIPKPSATPSSSTGTTAGPSKALPPKPANQVRTILERAQADAPDHSASQEYRKRRFGHAAPTTTTYSHAQTTTKYAHLLHQTTSEYDSNSSSDLPTPPPWVKAGIKYACQRSTPAPSPNDPFIDQLKKIKLARLLTNDEIGVRAYSTSIASLAAYPHKISSPREILSLPGCDVKIANLFVEWANSGRIRAADDAENDEEMKVLRLFYEIWGVGATTAREFYYERGWRDLDDVVEFGWNTLSRVQQIGVKYYEEFLDPIPRAEVEEIARVVHRHAVKVRDERVQSLVVGGYRRGKELCGDVDLIVSHPEEDKTLNIVNDIVASLEDEGWITHTLLLSLISSQRGQQTLPYRGDSGHGGHGFDTLDKALVVWQDPNWPTKEQDLKENPKAKNKNIHRRVDIIVSPWRTVGCAVAGWSGGTTFQRDLRRYAKAVKGWKFDSSGVRERSGGQFVDLEGWGKGPEGRAKTMEEAEKRVFEGLELEYREPWERCTG